MNRLAHLWQFQKLPKGAVNGQSLLKRLVANCEALEKAALSGAYSVARDRAIALRAVVLLIEADLLEQRAVRG